MQNEGEGSDVASEKEAGMLPGATPKTKVARKKRAKLMDPNAPKRPANAFLMFSDLQRNILRVQRKILEKRDDQPELLASLGNIVKAMGSKWKALDEEDRQFYFGMFKEQKTQYVLEMEEYLAIHPNAPMVGTLDPLPEDWTDPNAPRKPVNSFFVFCEIEEERLLAESNVEKTAEEEEVLLQVATLSLGKRWRLMSIEERQRNLHD